MSGKAAKIRLTEKQEDILQQIMRSTTAPKRLGQTPCDMERKLGKLPSKWENSGVGGLTIVICGTRSD